MDKLPGGRSNNTWQWGLAPGSGLQMADHIMSQLQRIVVFTALLLVAGGCAPSARFTRVDCRPVGNGDDLRGMAFTSSVSTVAMKGQQLIYRVRLLDGHGRPLRSSDDRFRDAEGNVAAAKALMAFDSPWDFDDVSIAIPAEELEIHPEDRPVGAEFSLVTPEGKVLAQTVRPLPFYGGPPPVMARATPPPPEPNEPRQRPAAPPPADTASAQPDASPSAPPPLAGTQPPADSNTPAETGERDDLFSMMYDAYRNTGTPPQGATTPSQAAEPPPVEHAEPAPQPVPAQRPPAAAPQQPPAPAPSPKPAPKPGPRPQPKKDTPKPPEYRIYVVQRGDTLTTIARRLYGKTSRWLDIFQLNRDQLDSPDLIYEGMELRVPLK